MAIDVPASWKEVNVEAKAGLPQDALHSEFFNKLLIPSFKHEEMEKAPPVSSFTSVSDGRKKLFSHSHLRYVGVRIYQT